jgi:hypothetical protein
MALPSALGPILTGFMEPPATTPKKARTWRLSRLRRNAVPRHRRRDAVTANPSISKP